MAILPSDVTGRAATVAILYIASGGAWIVFSAAALTGVEVAATVPVVVSIVGNLGFVLASAGFLFVGLRRILRREWAEGHQAQRLLTCAGEGLYSIDLNGLCTYANPALADILGYQSADDLIGSNIHALIHHHHPDGAPYTREQCPVHGHIAMARGLRDARETLSRKDGSLVTVSMVREPLTDRRKRLIGAVIAVRDITDQTRTRARLQDSEHRFRLLYENLPVAYQALDPDGIIREVNQAWLEQLGYRRDQVVGRPMSDFLPRDGHTLMQERLTTLKARREVHDFEFDMQTGTGQIRRMALDGRMSFDDHGQPLHTHCVLTDLTERRAFQAALDETLGDVARADAALLRFSRVVAHDLQEPVREVVSFLDLIHLRLGGDLPPDVAEFMTFARNAGVRMKDRLVALRGFVDVMSQRRRFQTTPLSMIWRDTLRKLGDRIHTTDAELDADPLPTVIGDPGLLGVLFRALTDNALRYARPDCPPRLRVHVDREPGAVVLRFRDNGRGIHPAVRSRVFEAFARDPRPGDPAANGMGLTVARKICDLHAGAVWIEDRADGKPGTVFCVRLPLPQDGNGEIDAEQERNVA